MSGHREVMRMLCAQNSRVRIGLFELSFQDFFFFFKYFFPFSFLVESYSSLFLRLSVFTTEISLAAGTRFAQTFGRVFGGVSGRVLIHGET